MNLSQLRKRISIVVGVVLCVGVTSLGAGLYLRFRTTQRIPAPQFPEPVRVDSVAEFLKLAGLLLRERKAEQAIVAYRQVLAAKPDSVEAQFGLAKGELLAGRGDVAAREFERVAELDPRHGAALLELAILYSQRRSTWQESARRYRSYLSVVPADAQAQLGLARVLAWEGKAAEASELYSRTEVVRLMTPADERDAVFSLLKLRRYGEAEVLLKKLLSRTPGDIGLTSHLAAIYAQRRDWPNALPLYRTLLAARPNDPRLNLTYGSCLLAARNYREALGPLRQAVSAMPDSGEAGLMYARALKGDGDLKRAAKEFERVLPQYSADARTQREYADLMLERRQYGKAVRYYRAAEQLGLRDERLVAGLGGALNAGHRYREAIPYMEATNKRAPTARRSLDLARAYARTGRKAEALAMLTKAESESRDEQPRRKVD
ncbi:MAG: tetratricopeptide repeat protein [Bryobacteraceae bacterium]